MSGWNQNYLGYQFLDYTWYSRQMAMTEHQKCLANIAKMECALAMCEHAVDGEHPKLVTTQRGERYWFLESTGLHWKEGTPCPIPSSAPGVAAS